MTPSSLLTPPPMSPALTWRAHKCMFSPGICPRHTCLSLSCCCFFIFLPKSLLHTKIEWGNGVNTYTYTNSSTYNSWGSHKYRSNGKVELKAITEEFFSRILLLPLLLLLLLLVPPLPLLLFENQSCSWWLYATRSLWARALAAPVTISCQAACT